LPVCCSEPADAIRAVNALLTQLDSLQAHANVMVLTTSNLTHAIDTAFVDRADIKAYVGPPALPARYDMLRSSLFELLRVGIVAECDEHRVVPPDGTLPKAKEGGGGKEKEEKEEMGKGDGKEQEQEKEEEEERWRSLRARFRFDGGYHVGCCDPALARRDAVVGLHVAAHECAGFSGRGTFMILP
jgi:hypothetical protein